MNLKRLHHEGANFLNTLKSVGTYEAFEGKILYRNHLLFHLAEYLRKASLASWGHVEADWKVVDGDIHCILTRRNFLYTDIGDGRIREEFSTETTTIFGNVRLDKNFNPTNVRKDFKNRIENWVFLTDGRSKMVEVLD